MSQFKFHQPSRIWFPEALHPCTLVTDFNQKPVPARMTWSDDELSLDLLEDECGRVHTLVQTSTSGSVFLGTPWLFPKLSGYRLEIELLRGLLSRIRNAAEMWEANQIPLPEKFEKEISTATKQFIGIWKTNEFSTIEQSSLQFLNKLLDMSRKLSNELLDRQGQDPFTESTKDSKSGFVIGTRIDLSRPGWNDADSQEADSHTIDSEISIEDSASGDLQKLDLVSSLRAIDTISIRQPWIPMPKSASAETRANSRYVESIAQKIRQSRKRTILGPVFDVSRDAIPSGVTLAKDGEHLRQDLVNTLQHQLPSVAADLGLLHVVGGINGIGVNGLTPTIQSHLVIDALEAANTIAPYTQLMISFDQPYCERHAWSVGGQTPEYFLTKLVKQRTPLHAIGLEFNLGYFPRGTLPRTDLDWVMLLHSWAMWEVPIYILLRTPSKIQTIGRSKLLSPVDTADDALPSTAASITHLVKLFSSLPWIHGVMLPSLIEDDPNYPTASLTTADDSELKQLFIR